MFAKIYGTENLNALTVRDVTDASSHVIGLCSRGQCHHFVNYVNYGIIAISKDSSGIRPSYEISVTEVLIDMWRGIENR